jgi:hypothetical protein
VVGDCAGHQDVVLMGQESLQNVLVAEVSFLVGVLGVKSADGCRIKVVLVLSGLKIDYMRKVCMALGDITPFLSRSMTLKHSA